MSDHGAYEDEMGRFRRLSEEELARLYAGTDPTADRTLEDLADFIQDVAMVLTEAPDGSTEARHLAAIAEAAQLLTEDATAAGFERQPIRPTRRRRLVPNTLRLKIALTAVMALAAFSGAAYAGALPDQVQRPVADIADNVGVSLPDGQENDVDQGNVNDLDQGDQTNVDDGPQNDVDDSAKNNDDDGATNDVDDAANDNVDDGPQNNVDDGTKNDVDDSAQNDVDYAAKNDVDDSAQNDVDDGAKNDVDDAAKNDVDDAAKDNVEDGAKDNVDQGAESDNGGADLGDPGTQGGEGNQTHGDG